MREPAVPSRWLSLLIAFAAGRFRWRARQGKSTISRITPTTNDYELVMGLAHYLDGGIFTASITALCVSPGEVSDLGRLMMLCCTCQL